MTTNSTSSAAPTLSPREAQILRLMCSGLRTGEIAKQLGLSSKTVDTYRERLKKKANARNSVQIGMWAACLGITECQDYAQAR